MYCQYCKSKIFEEDRVCCRCGAPTKDFLEEFEEIRQYSIAPNSDAPISAIASTPSFLLLSKFNPYQQLAVYGIKGGASHNVIITKIVVIA